MKPQNSRYVTLLFLFVFALVTLALFRLLGEYSTAIIMALVLCSLFNPMHKRIRQRFPRKEIAAGITTTIVVGLVLIPIGLFIGSLSAQAIDVYQNVTKDHGIIDELRMHLATDSRMMLWLSERLTPMGIDFSAENIASLVDKAATMIGTFAYENLGGLASNTLSFVVEFCMMILVMYAVFAEGTKLKAYLLDLSPFPDEQEEMLADRFDAMSRAVFVGNGVGSLLQGIFGGIGFYLFGLGNGILWGTAVAFFAFLPVVGASVIVVPAALYLFAIGKIGAGIGFVIYNVIHIFILEYGLKTKMIGDQSSMNAALVFIGIVAGIALFGVLGLFYGPLLIAMFLAVADLYRAHYRDDLMSRISPWLRADIGKE